MVSAIQTIALSRDLVVIRAFELFHDQLLREADGTLDQIEDGLKSVLGNVEVISPMLQALKLHGDQPLPPTDSVDLARRLFVEYAQHPPFEPLIIRCIEEWPDNVQRVATVLSVGVVGAVWLCLMSTSFTYKEGGVEIHKDALSAEQIHELRGFVQPKIEATLNLRAEKAGTPRKDEHLSSRHSGGEKSFK